MGQATTVFPTTTAVLGCGVIGSSWVTAFHAARHKVRVWDPDLAAAGAKAAKGLDAVTLCDTPEAAVEGAHFVQENGPENLAAKCALFARIGHSLESGAVDRPGYAARPAGRVLPDYYGTVFDPLECADLRRRPHEQNQIGHQHHRRAVSRAGRAGPPLRHARPAQRRARHRRAGPGLDGRRVPHGRRAHEAARRRLWRIHRRLRAIWGPDPVEFHGRFTRSRRRRSSPSRCSPAARR